MEVLTIENSAFQMLMAKLEAMDEYIRTAKLEQQSVSDDDWVDGRQYVSISASATKPCNAYARRVKSLTA